MLAPAARGLARPGLAPDLGEDGPYQGLRHGGLLDPLHRPVRLLQRRAHGLFRQDSEFTLVDVGYELAPEPTDDEDGVNEEGHGDRKDQGTMLKGPVEQDPVAAHAEIIEPVESLEWEPEQHAGNSADPPKGMAEDHPQDQSEGGEDRRDHVKESSHEEMKQEKGRRSQPPQEPCSGPDRP